MAILSISRIQHRRGLQENLPQLASGELGWSIDQRRLFIGNGTTEEGAPQLGNTEIITEFSNILEILGLYTYHGTETGTSVLTGRDVLSRVERSFSNKLDDIVNGRDFGIVGDGITNDVDAINRAIVQLYNEAVLVDNARVRRTLHLAAGTYKLDGDYIRLLPYVRITGEGKHSTIIKQTDPSQPCTITTVGSTTAGLLAGKIDISNLTVQNTTANDVFIVNAASDVYADRVWFKGPIAVGTQMLNPGTGKSCVKFDSADATVSDKIIFDNCDFTEQIYAVFSAKTIKNVLITASNFDHLYQGVSLGYINDGIDSIRVTTSNFNDIYSSAIIGMNGVTHFVSAFNAFTNCGNGGGVSIYAPVVSFSGNGCYSIGDLFDRTESDENSSYPNVELNGTQSYAISTNGKVQSGSSVVKSGRAYTLVDGQLTPETVGVLNPVSTNVTFNYVINRGTKRRSGTMKVLTDGVSDIGYDDSYLETDDVGITLMPVIDSGNGSIDLVYQSTVELGTPAITLKITSSIL